MHRIEIDVQTGEQRTVELTTKEIAAIEATPQPEPPPLTAAEKLERIGFTVGMLKELLGLS